MVYVSSIMWRIKNQPSNSISCDCWFLWQAYYIEDFKWCLHFQFGVVFWRVVLRKVEYILEGQIAFEGYWRLQSWTLPFQGSHVRNSLNPLTKKRDSNNNFFLPPTSHNIWNPNLVQDWQIQNMLVATEATHNFLAYMNILFNVKSAVAISC